VWQESRGVSLSTRIKRYSIEGDPVLAEKVRLLVGAVDPRFRLGNISARQGIPKPYTAQLCDSRHSTRDRTYSRVLPEMHAGGLL